MCKDCPSEIFVDVNMIMLKDDLWTSIADKHEDSYCDKCIEKRLGRKITKEDFKQSTLDIPGLDMIPCNAAWLWHQKSPREKEIAWAEFNKSGKII